MFEQLNIDIILTYVQDLPTHMRYAFCSLFFSLFIASCAHKNGRDTACAYYEAAVAEAEEARLPEALYYIEKSLSCAPLAKTLALKAQLLYNQKQFAESARLFKQVIEHPTATESLKAEALNNYAIVQQELGNTQQARAIWQELVHNPAYSTPEVAYYNLGLDAFSQNNFKQADSYFSAALKRSPDYIDALFYKALCCFLLDKLLEARDLFEQVVKLVPEHPGAAYFLRILSGSK